MIKCQQCGEENPLSTRFCLSCAKPLDFSDMSQISAPTSLTDSIGLKEELTRIEKRKKTPFLAVILQFALLLWAFLLILMGYTGHTDSPEITMADVKKFSEKEESLTQSNLASLVLNEKDFTIWVQRHKDNLEVIFLEHALLKRCRLETVYVTLESSETTIYVVMKLFAKKLVLSLRGLVRKEGPLIEFKTSRLKIGNLPLSLNYFSSLNKLLATYAGNTLNAMFKESSGSVSHIIVKDQDMHVYFGKNNETDDRVADDEVPEDFMLALMGNYFFDKGYFGMAGKYYKIILSRYPKTPFRASILEKLKLSIEKMEIQTA